MIHELKVWPEYFRPIWLEEKKFEVRKNDRNFQRGDGLQLKEYDPKKKKYTGREEYYEVTYILYGPDFGIKKGYCVMSIQ